MINIKQLKYFITCADAGSFSEAASVLYTTQSSVSKVIRSLEEEMQASLFVRSPHGIGLTPNGKQAYAYASRVLENVEAMAELSAVGDIQWLNIAFNPSSWIADCFVRFYQIHEKENLHCQAHTGNYEGWKLDAENSLTLGKIDVSVVTNSDYIMEKMLDHGNLANISGDSLNPGKTPSRPGICLTNESGKIMFGYVKRGKTPLSDLAMKFLDYVKQELIG